MTREGNRDEQPDELSELERQAEEARRHEADAERRADDALERAEALEEKSRKLGEAGDEIRRKASEPVGFPPPPKAKQKPT